MPLSSHAHEDRRAASRRALVLVLVLLAGYTVVEVIGGLLTGSLALLADAGHMLSDVMSIGLALLAIWLAQRPPTFARSFGYQRAEILVALINGAALVAIGIWIFVEAYQRFSDPPDVLGGWMLAVAAVGLLVNVLAAVILWGRQSDSLNMRAALRHVLADLLGSVGVIAAALIILATGWLYADPLISVLIGALVLGSSWTILRESVDILLESTPAGVDAREVARRMLAVDGVRDVHDLHIWTITSGFPALSAHVLVSRGEDCHDRRRQLERLLAVEFGITHSTLQVEHVPANLVSVAGLKEREDER
ncbi:MAG TPA: cation diffusion facilitator family transporter [Gaiellaceae bacterium]|jgi:cobalt-zinc-cadmium efflux system protein|nr:cation diffusion facilitator family transporter [Gaiellaceae bacterium]